jgi:hypothetical protein
MLVPKMRDDNLRHARIGGRSQSSGPVVVDYHRDLGQESRVRDVPDDDPTPGGQFDIAKSRPSGDDEQSGFLTNGPPTCCKSIFPSTEEHSKGAFSGV